MRDLMFAFVWMALLPLCFISAHVGVLLWAWVALLSPADLLTGFMSGVPLNKIVALATFALVLVSREKKDFYLGTSIALMGALAVSATLSWAFGIVHTDDSDYLYQKLLKEVALAVVITGVMTTRHRIHALVMTVVVALGFLGVKEGAISIFTAGGHLIIGSGAVGDNNAEALALLMIVPLTLYLARYSAVRLIRQGLYLTVALSLITIVMTFSRGGFIGLLVLGAFFIAQSRRKVSGLALVAAVAVLILVLAPGSWWHRLSTIRTADDDGSFMGRVVAWKLSWLMAMDRPFLGGGPHAIQHAVVWSRYIPFLPQLDFIATPPPDTDPHAAHSIYFEVLGDLGFTGLALFLAMIAASLADCRAIVRRARGRPDLAWAADLARMTQIALVIYLVSGAALSMGYFELLYILVAVNSRVRRIVTRPLPVVARDDQQDGVVYAGTPGWAA